MYLGIITLVFVVFRRVCQFRCVFRCYVIMGDCDEGKIQ